MIPQELKTIIDFTIGDGYIGIRKPYNSIYGRIEHSTKQVTYAKHKESILIDCGFPLSSREFIVQSGKNAGRSYYQINLKSHPLLRTAHKWLYNKNKKGIDKALLSILDEKSLAYWFMDDGSGKLVKYNQQKNGTRHYYEMPKIGCFIMCNQSFTYHENILIQSWLKEKFDIQSHVIWHSGYEIHISDRKNKERFRYVIEPYVIPSMFYKIQYPLIFNGIPYVAVQRDRLSELDSSYCDEYATVESDPLGD